MKRYISFLGALVASSFSISAVSAETFKPANFDFSGNQLSALVAKPYIFTSASDLPVLYCQSDISIAGKARNASCHDAKDNYHVEVLTESALEKLAFEPAQVNGKPVPVRMHFRIVFSGDSDQVVATAFPNLGSMQRKLGATYFAPQERLDVSDWQKTYSEKSRLAGSTFLADSDLSRFAAMVDTNGKPVTVRALSTLKGTKRDAKLVKSTLKRSRFIPAFANGEPQTAGYLAIVNYSNSTANNVASK